MSVSTRHPCIYHCSKVNCIVLLDTSPEHSTEVGAECIWSASVQILRKHALQVMQLLGVVIKGLGDLATLIPKITALAQRHVGYGVELPHYELLGRALLGTLEQVYIAWRYNGTLAILLAVRWALTRRYSGPVK